MIDEKTPYKLDEIIRDTWPNLYRPFKDFKPPSKYLKSDFLPSPKVLDKSLKITYNT
jgi:hypothetical protein